MAGEKNFNIKNGLSVQGTEVIQSDGTFVGSISATALNESVDDRVASLLQAGSGISLSYDDAANQLTITGNVGDITGVNAGAGLTGTATSGDATLNIGAGTGITVNADDIEVDTSVVATLTGSQTLTNKTLTSAVLNTGVSGTAILDEDDMSSNSATQIPTQQSVKAYVDSQILTKDNTDEITEGSSNLYFTNERVDDRVNALITAGSNITTTYDDVANTLTIAATEDNLSNNDTDDLAEGSTNLYHTTARARSAISVSGDLSYNSSTGVISFTNDAGDIESVTAGDGLSGGGTSGAVSLAVNVDDSSIETSSDTLQVKALGITDAMLAGSISNAKLSNSSISVNSNSVSLGGAVVLDTDDVGEGSTNQYFTNERVDDRVNALITAGTNITTSYDDANGTLTINSSGKTEEEIEDIVNGLVIGGTNITSTYDDAAGTLTLAGLSDSAIRGLFSAGGDLSYNSSTGAFSVTTYTDSDARGAISVTDSAGDGTLSYNSTTGVITYSGITDAQVRGKVSVTDAGGDGSLAYNSGTGVITYTGPSASETRAHFSAGTGVSISSGQVSIGQSVGTSDNVSFGDLTLSGDLTVNGTTTTVNTATLNVSDNIVVLNNDVTGTPSEDAGIEVERGTSANVSLTWDESEDEWTFGSYNVKASSFEGSLTGNASTATSAAALTNARTISLGGDLSGSASFDGSANITISAAVADDSHNHTIANVDGLQTALNTKYESGSNATLGTITTSNASNSGGYVRNIYQSTSSPSSGDGAVGDLWVLYS